MDEDEFSGRLELELEDTHEPTALPTVAPTASPTVARASPWLAATLWLVLIVIAGGTLYRTWRAFRERETVRRITLMDDNDLLDEEDEEVLGPRHSAVDATYIS